MDPKELAQKALDEQKRVFEEMKSTLSAAEKKGDTEKAEFKTKIEKMQADIDAQQKTIEAFQAKMNRPDEGAETKSEKETREGMERKGHFISAIRKQLKGLSEAETKTLALSDDEAGGYLAPNEVSSELISNITEISPIRSIANVVPITSRGIEIPKKTSGSTFYWYGEQSNPTESNPKFGMTKIYAHSGGALSKVTTDMLEDVPFLMQYLRDDWSEQIAAGEGAAFCTGNGVSKPEGIITNTDISVTTSGVKAVVDFDDLTELEASLKAFYRTNARYIFNDDTRKKLTLLKNEDGQRIWQPAVALAVPATINGFPYTVCQDLANISASSKSVAFGDFRRGYQIVDRRTITVRTIDQTYFPLIAYAASVRVGGYVKQSEAIKILQTHA